MVVAGRRSDKIRGNWSTARRGKRLFRLSMLIIVVLLTAVYVFQVVHGQKLVRLDGWSVSLGTTITGLVLSVLGKLFDVLGGNVICDAFKAVFTGKEAQTVSLSAGGVKTESVVLDGYKIKKEPFKVFRLHAESYVEAEAFAREGSDRLKAEKAIWKLAPGRSALIGLYAAVSCGRQALVSASLKEALCPVYVLKLKEPDIESVRSRIVGFVNDFPQFEDGTFYVRLARMLSGNESLELMKMLSRTLSEAEENGKTIRVIVSFNCLEVLKIKDIGELFQLGTLDADESGRFLSVVASRCATQEHPNPLGMLRQAYRGARLGRIVHAYSQGNPIGIVRFVETFLAQSVKADSPLVVLERGWWKQAQHLNLSEHDRLIAQAVLHFVLALSAGGSTRSVDVRPLLDDLYGGTCGDGEYAKIQAFLSIVLSLPEDVALCPFDLGRVAYDEVRYDPYVFSCGEGDYLKYSNAWQKMYLCVLSHPDLNACRRDFCNGVVSAAIRAALINALPYQQSPRCLYGLVDNVLSRALSAKFDDESVRSDVGDFVQGFQEEAWLRIADGVIEHLARRFDSMMSDEILNVIREDLLASGSDEDYLERLSELLPFMCIGCPDPVFWCVSREDVASVVDRMLSNASLASADSVCTFCWLLDEMLLGVRDFLVFTGNDGEAQKWAELVRVAKARAVDSCSPKMRRLLAVLERGESRIKEMSSGLDLIELWRGELEMLHSETDESALYLALLTFVGAIGCADTLLRQGDVDIADSLLDNVKKTIDACPFRILSVRKWLLPNVMHKLAMSRTLRIPDVDRADALEGFYQKMRNRMDEISAQCGFDGENRPRFLIDLALSVDAMLSRYHMQKEYEEVLGRELHAILRDVREIRDAVNYQDLMRVMILLGRHLPSCDSGGREWFIALWDELEGRIPGESGAVKWLSRREIDAFAQCAGFVMADPEFASQRFTTDFLSKVANSSVLGQMTENAKLAWAESLFPPFGPHDLLNITTRLARIALGEDRMASLFAASSGEVLCESVLRHFIESRKLIPSTRLDRTDAVFDGIVMSVVQFVASDAFKNSDEKCKVGTISSIQWIIDNYVFPAAKAASMEDGSFRAQDVGNLLVLQSCVVGSGVAEDKIIRGDLAKEIEEFMLSERCKRIVASVLGCDLQSPERTVRVLSSLNARSPLERLNCVARMALSGCSVSELPEFPPEHPQFARQLYGMVVEAFSGLSSDVLQSVGYAYYDSIIESLFAPDADFVSANPDFAQQMLQYVQQELSQRRKPAVIKQLTKAIKKAVKSGKDR